MPEGAESRARRRRDALYKRLLAASDVVAAAAAVALAVLALGDSDSITPTTFLLLPVVVLVGKVAGLYDRDQHLVRPETLGEVPRLVQTATFLAFGLWLTEGVFIKGHLGQGQALLLWVLLFVLLVVGRACARRVAARLAHNERVLVLGDGRAAERLRQRAGASAGAGIDVVGRVSLGAGRRAGETSERGGEDSRVPLLGGVDELRSIITDHRIDRVIIAPGALASDEALDLIRLVKFLGTRVSILPNLFEVVGSSVEFDEVDGMTVLGVRPYGLPRSSAMLKRGLDITVSVAGLVLLSPLLVAIVLAVRLDSPGPALFRQRRVGARDREFEILKFRTMVDGAHEQRDALVALNETEGLFKIAADPRHTRVGRLLRRTSLDELPQLLNVLRGEMSLVGPRPLVPDEDSRVEGWARRRLELPPGMTGPWQVLGSARIPLHEMVKLDYLYGANWSLWNDVKLLLRTVPFVVSRRGM